MKFIRSSFLTYILFLAYILGGIVAIAYSFIYNFHKEHIGLVFLSGGVIAFIISRHPNKSPIIKGVTEEKKSLSQLSKIMFILFICLSVISVVIFENSKVNYYLSLQYFLIISLIGCLISIQILIPESISKSEEYLILLEISILSGIIGASFLFLFPGPYGNDALYHINFINRIINSGNIESYYGPYQNYPGYYLLFIFIKLSTGINDFKIIQFILSFIQIFFLIFVFMLVKKISNLRVALISTLLTSLSPHIIQAKYSYLIETFTTIFFILILFLIFYPNFKRSVFSSLIIIVFVTTLFTHPLTPAIIIATLLAILIVSKFLKFNKLKISTRSILLMSILTISWWMKPYENQQNLLSNLIDSIKDAFFTFNYTNVERVTLASHYSLIDVILNDLGLSLLTFFAIVGAFCILIKICLHGQKTKFMLNEEKLLSLSIITLLFIPLPYILAIIYPLSLPDRWFPFIEILMSLSGGAGILFIVNSLKRYKFQYTVIMLLFILVFFSITTPIVNPNNQIYAKALSGRSGLTNSEISTAEFINWQSPREIYANEKYITFINESYWVNNNFINPNNPNKYKSGLVVIRNYDLEKGFTIPLFGSEGAFLNIIYPDNQFYAFLNDSNKLYENKEVRIYYNP
jgi:hypothetical protein